MEPKRSYWHVRVSKTEREKIAELARRLGTKEAPAFRFALTVALEQTDPKKNPNALKNVLVLS